MTALSHSELAVEVFPSAAQVAVRDGDGRLVSSTLGGVTVPVEEGIYALDVGVGETRRHLILVREGENHRERYEIDFPTVAPLRRLAAVGPSDPRAAGLVLVTDGECTVELLTADQTLVLAAGPRSIEESPDLAPGPYLLRFTGPAGGHEVPIWLPAGWRTTVFVRGDDADGAVVASTVHLTAAGRPWDPDSDANVSLEAALSYLRRGYDPPVRSIHVDDTLVEQNPCLGLALAYLMDPARFPDRRDRLLALLHDLIPGHPDLWGLAPGHRAEWPPLFARGTRALGWAAATDRSLLSLGPVIESAVTVMTGRGAWTAWPRGDLAEAAVARHRDRRIAEYLGGVAARQGISRAMAAEHIDMWELAEATALPVQVVAAWRVARYRAADLPDPELTRIARQLEEGTVPREVGLDLTPDPDGRSGTLVLRERMSLADIPVTVTGENDDLRMLWLAPDREFRVPLHAGRLHARISETLRVGEGVYVHVPRPSVAAVGAGAGRAERRHLDLPSGVGVELAVPSDRRLHVTVTSAVPEHAGRYVAVVARYGTSRHDETHLLIPLIADEDERTAHGTVVLDRRSGVEVFAACTPSGVADPAALTRTLRHADDWTRRGLAALAGLDDDEDWR